MNTVHSVRIMVKFVEFQGPLRYKMGGGEFNLLVSHTDNRVNYLADWMPLKSVRPQNTHCSSLWKMEQKAQQNGLRQVHNLHVEPGTCPTWTTAVHI